jgi:hypothetical protein
MSIATISAPLDEQALRLPGFHEGQSVGVLFGDGRVWHVPRPREVYVADDSDAGAVLTWNLGNEFAALVERYRETATSGDAKSWLGSIARIWVHLLSLNYDLAKADARRLVQLRIIADADLATDDGPRLIHDLTDLLSGRLPREKPSPVA